ncbi:MAG: hypothetical protein GX444_12315 [Myxococcales bacterium]|nr:hypothetical protein [Myxococcales bacterium]
MVRAAQLYPPVTGTGTAIISTRSERRPAVRPDWTADERQRDSLERADRETLRAANRENPSPADSQALNVRQVKTNATPAWKDKIPANALFYDQVADLANGVNEPGMLLSVRV